MVKVAIVCEGKNDKEFIQNLLNHLGLKKHEEFFTFNGKSDIFKTEQKRYGELKLLIETGQIDKVLFVVDADDERSDVRYGGYENTTSALNTTINALGLREISSSYIFCDPITQTGNLEAFILSTISETQRNCIQAFLDCSQFKSKENHKAILNQIYRRAYPNSPYDFKHAHFAEIKSILSSLILNTSSKES